MPKLKRQEKEIELKVGENLSQAAENLGIPFSCHTGICGTCVVNVNEGEENLTPMTQEEEDLGMGGGMRLACQCCIKDKDLKIE